MSVSSVDTSSDSSSDTELQSIDVVENPPSWTNENLRPFNTPFSNLQDGPNLLPSWDMNSETVDYFKLFLTPDIVEKITMYTNQYAWLSIMKKRTTKPCYVDHDWDIHGSDNVSEGYSRF